MSKKILVLGKSDLGHGLQKISPEHQISIVGRPEFDFSMKEHCDEILRMPSYDVYVLTQAILHTQDLYKQMLVNLTNSVYLISKLYDKLDRGQIIFVSSAAVNWVSFPSIKNDRLFYNWTKESVSKFCEHLNRKNADNEKDISIQVFEPNSFNSKMNVRSSIELQNVSTELKSLIENPRISIMRGMNRNV